MKQHKPEKIASSPLLYSPLSLSSPPALTFTYTLKQCFIFGQIQQQRHSTEHLTASERAPGVNNPSMDIWDGGRETEKGTHLDRD